MDLPGLRAALREHEARIVGALSGAGAAPSPRARRYEENILYERTFWSEAIHNCMTEQAKQLQDFFAEEVQKQTQQLQSFMADTGKGVAEVTMSSAMEVDEFRSVVRADVHEVVSTEVQAAMAPSWVSGSGGFALRNSHGSERAMSKVSEPARSKVSAPSKENMTAQSDNHAGSPLLPDGGGNEAKAPQLGHRRELGYALLEYSPTSSFVDSIRSQYPHISDPFIKLLGKLDDLWNFKEPPRTGCLANFVASTPFQAFGAAVIIANACFMTYSVNMSLQRVGKGGADDESRLDTCFLLVYIAELLCKLGVNRWFYFWNEDMTWNWLDFTLILQGLMDSVLPDGGGGQNTWFRTIRLFKVAKVLRILRIVRFFTQLHMIISAVIGSILHLFWSMLVFALLFFMFSLFIVSNVEAHMQDLGNADGEESQAMLQYFGSVQLSMRTLLFTVTGGEDWDEFYYALMPVGTARYGFLFFIVFSNIAFLNIVTGIFVENAMKIAQPDALEKADEQFTRERDHAVGMQTLLEAADKNDDGMIQRAEFEDVMNKGQFRIYLMFLNIDPTWSNSNLALIFDVLAEQHRGAGQCESDEVSIAVLVEQIMALRGFATGTEVIDLDFRLRHIQNLQEQLMSHVGRICPDRQAAQT